MAPAESRTPLAQAKEPSFLPGNKVMLRSGGQGMTVIDVGQNTGLIWCSWAVSGVVMERAFTASALIRDPRSLSN